MKVRKLKAGSKIEVGDFILHDSWMGKKWYKIVRVTEKFAVVAWNDVGRGRFPRVVPEIGLKPCGERNVWARVEYSAWRPLEP